MGQHNRQRRAAKQRNRSRAQRGQASGSRPDPRGAAPRGSDFGARDDAGARTAADALRRLVRDRAACRYSPEAEREFLAHRVEHQQLALDRQLDEVVERLFDTGWSPLDLFEVFRRKSPESAVTHLLDVAASATARHPAALVHPRWQAQLDQLEAILIAPSVGSPSHDWSAQARLTWAEASAQLLELLVHGHRLPVVQSVLPRPGHATSMSAPSDPIDAKVFRKVRALLAKAESTEHEHEADAFTAKAQELMTRYSIERALADAHHPIRPTPGVRRMWLDSPYVNAKSTLVSAVSRANHCRSVLHTDWGFVTLIGHDNDLDVVELLTTSLLVQATRAMTSAGSQATSYGVSRTRSFRQSFLVSYGRRIGERLRESTQSTETAADSASGGNLLPVLAARVRIVDDTFGELFPDVVSRPVGVSNASGWGAGRAAADLAQLNIRDALPARQRAG